MLRYILLPFLVFSLIITAIYSLSVLREGGTERAAKAPGDRQVSRSRMEGITIVNTRKGNRQWLLRSREIIIAGEDVMITGVDGNVEDLDMLVRSSEGQYDMSSGDLTLTGGVELQGNSYSITVPEASLISSSERLSSESDVVIDGRNFRVEGSGLIADSTGVRILRDVKAVFY